MRLLSYKGADRKINVKAADFNKGQWCVKVGQKYVRPCASVIGMIASAILHGCDRTSQLAVMLSLDRYGDVYCIPL
jgi:hypothetical protein